MIFLKNYKIHDLHTLYNGLLNFHKSTVVKTNSVTKQHKIINYEYLINSINTITEKVFPACRQTA